MRKNTHRGCEVISLSTYSGSYAGSCWKLRAGQRIIGCVAETIEALERRIDELRVAVREAVLAGDPAVASARRAELRRAEQAWEDELAAAAAPVAAPGDRTHAA